MKTFSVIYTPLNGRKRTYGPFNTYKDAYEWMKAYSNYCYTYSKQDNKEIVINAFTNEDGIEIISIDLDTMEVVENHTLDWDASKGV